MSYFSDPGDESFNQPSLKRSEAKDLSDAYALSHGIKPLTKVLTNKKSQYDTSALSEMIRKMNSPDEDDVIPQKHQKETVISPSNQQPQLSRSQTKLPSPIQTTILVSREANQLEKLKITINELKLMDKKMRKMEKILEQIKIELKKLWALQASDQEKLI